MNHAAIKGVSEFEAWDETYVHKNHNLEGRTVLQVREVAENDNITKPESWTWVRDQGRGCWEFAFSPSLPFGYRTGVGGGQFNFPKLPLRKSG